jgi:Ca-activated chloride channel family protein
MVVWRYALYALGILVLAALIIGLVAHFAFGASSFSFKSPWLLLSLLVVPLVVGGYVFLERGRAERAARWSSPTLLPNMIAGAPGDRRYIPAVIFAVALVLLLVGFARPQAKVKEARDGATVVLMIDTSGSMGANDVKPTRLAAADAALTEFVTKLPSRYRAALITFSSGIAVKVPPTYDRTAILKALPAKAQLDGTAMGDAVSQAVKVARKAVGTSKPGNPHPPASILLVSDGGNNAGQIQPSAAAQQAKKASVPISTIALGSVAGVVHQNVPLGTGKQTFPLVQQVPVETKTLKQLATASGGRFYAATSAAALSQVYKDLGKRLVYNKQFREITVGLTVAAFVLILAGAGLSAWWFRRLV